MKTTLISLTVLLALVLGGCGDDTNDTSCTVADNGDGTFTISCDDGTHATFDDDESCTVVDNGDDTATITCDDGTSATIGEDDSCTAADNGDGSYTITCDDGTSARVSARQILMATGTVNPGQSLTLTHGFTNVVATAQYEQDGHLFPLRDYPNNHSPVTYGPVAVTDSTSIDNPLALDALSNGNLIFAYETYEYNSGASYNGGFFRVLDTMGSTVAGPIVFSPLEERIDSIAVGALTGGGFVVAWQSDSATALHVQRYDNGGVAQDATLLLDDASPDLSGGVQVAGTADGGYWVAYGVDADWVRRIRRYSATGVAQGAPADLPTNHDSTYNYPFAMEALSGGGVVLVHQVSFDNMNGRRLEAVYLDSTGVVDSTTLVANDHCDNLGVAIAPNGNICVGFEYGGPDGVGYVLLDQVGNILAGPEPVTDHEPRWRSIRCGAFGDGDFAVHYAEDDSQTGVMNNITNAGMPVGGVDYWSGNLSPSVLETAPLPGHEMLIVYDPYTSTLPAQLIHVSKGYLAVETVSATQVQVTNYAAEPATVVLTAIGSD